MWRGFSNFYAAFSSFVLVHQPKQTAWLSHCSHQTPIHDCTQQCLVKHVQKPECTLPTYDNTNDSAHHGTVTRYFFRCSTESDLKGVSCISMSPMQCLCFARLAGWGLLFGTEHLFCTQTPRCSECTFLPTTDIFPWSQNKVELCVICTWSGHERGTESLQFKPCRFQSSCMWWKATACDSWRGRNVSLNRQKFFFYPFLSKYWGRLLLTMCPW